MINLFLSPETPRWAPRTEGDLQAAIDNGLLEESHWLELKREIEPGRAANRELARDLCSFAIDSGALLVGIEEIAGQLKLAPQLHAGLPERIEQVARTLPDPPLTVVSRIISSSDDPARGYVVVTVPPSGQAPHMVDHRYLGRGDKTKHYLSDAEVLRHHERRRAVETDVLALVDAEIVRDPIPAEQRKLAHLFLVAEPLPGRSSMLLDLVSGDSWQQRLIGVRDAGMQRDLLQAIGLSGFSPDLDSASSQHRRPQGAALVSYQFQKDRTLSNDQFREQIIEFEVSEDGPLRLFCGRLSDVLDRNGTEVQVLFDSAAVLLTRRFLRIVAAAAEDAGYLGTWGLGIGATGLRGLSSYEYTKGFWDGSAYAEDSYRRATTATYAELTRSPGRLTNTLLGRLLRALGTERQFNMALTDPPGPEEQDV